MAKGAMGQDPGKRQPAQKIERRPDRAILMRSPGVPLNNLIQTPQNMSFLPMQQGPQTDPGFDLNQLSPNDPFYQELVDIGQRMPADRARGYQPPPQQNIPSTNPQDIYGYSGMVGSLNKTLASPARNSFMQQYPAYRPFENPAPGQAPQQGYQDEMLGQGIQQAIQGMTQSMPAQPPAPSYLGGNQNRVRQSAGIYKDPATGALYNSKNQMIRRGR